MPQRGVHVPVLAAGSPMSSLPIRTHLCFSGSSSISSIRQRCCSSTSGAVRQRPAGVLDLARPGRRAAPPARRASAAAGRRGPGTEKSKPLRGQADTNSEDSSASRRSTWSSSVRRAGRSSGATRGSEGPAGAPCGGVPGRQALVPLPRRSGTRYQRLSPGQLPAAPISRGLERLDDRPEGLLDADQRHALHLQSASTMRVVCWRHAALLGDTSPEARASVASSSAITIWRLSRAPAAAQLLAAPVSAQPDSPPTFSASNAITGHAGLERGDHQRVVEQVAARSPPHSSRSSAICSTGGAVGVGVDPDLAPEHPVGPGHRVLAHVDHVPAGDPARRARRRSRTDSGAAARAARRPACATGPARELLGQLDVDPALLQLGVGGHRAHFRRSRARAWARSSSSVRLPSLVRRTLPPAVGEHRGRAARPRRRGSSPRRRGPRHRHPPPAPAHDLPDLAALLAAHDHREVHLRERPCASARPGPPGARSRRPG